MLSELLYPTLDNDTRPFQTGAMKPRAPDVLRICIVEDNERERDILADLLRRAAGFEIAGVHARPESAWSLLRTEAPDLVLLDLVFADGPMSGHDFLLRLRGEAHPPKVVAWTAHGDEGHFFAALKAGACGYLLKTTPLEQLPGALRAAYQGELRVSAGVARLMLREFVALPISDRVEPSYKLSDRERTVLELLAAGHSQGEIAARLGLSLRTVEMHLAAARQKLSARTSAQATALYARGSRKGVADRRHSSKILES